MADQYSLQTEEIQDSAMFHRASRPMEVVKDVNGELWLCDKGANPSQDLAGQGCWRCGDMAFTRND